MRRHGAGDAWERVTTAAVSAAVHGGGAGGVEGETPEPVVVFGLRAGGDARLRCSGEMK